MPVFFKDGSAQIHTFRLKFPFNNTLVEFQLIVI